jgi:hypothetical protein
MCPAGHFKNAAVRARVNPVILTEGIRLQVSRIILQELHWAVALAILREVIDVVRKCTGPDIRPRTAPCGCLIPVEDVLDSAKRRLGSAVGVGYAECPVLDWVAARVPVVCFFCASQADSTSSCPMAEPALMYERSHGFRDDARPVEDYGQWPDRLTADDELVGPRRLDSRLGE